MFSFIHSKQKRKPKTDDEPRTITVVVVLLAICALIVCAFVVFMLTRQPSRDGGLARSAAGQLLFIRREAGNNDVYVVDGNGDVTRITTSGAQENAATWMPEGIQIAIAAADELQTERLYVINANGSEVRLLHSREVANSHAYLLYSSADGDHLLWGTERVDRSTTAWYMVDVLFGYTYRRNAARDMRWLEEGNPLIFGENDFPEVPDTIEEQLVQRMILSPDGRLLALTTTLGTQGHIYTIEPDGDNLTLVESADAIGFAAWSPDNQHIAYIENITPASVSTTPNLVRLVDTQSHTTSTIVEGMSGLSRIEWSPDGQQLAFTVHDADANVYNLYAVNVDGSNLRLLAENVLNTATTRWRP